MYLNLNQQFISEFNHSRLQITNVLQIFDCKIRYISKYNAFVTSTEKIVAHSTFIEITQSLAENAGICLSPFNPFNTSLGM